MQGHKKEVTIRGIKCVKYSTCHPHEGYRLALVPPLPSRIIRPCPSPNRELHTPTLNVSLITLLQTSFNARLIASAMSTRSLLSFVITTLSLLLVHFASFSAAAHRQQVLKPTTAAASATALASANGYSYVGCWNETRGFKSNGGARALTGGKEVGFISLAWDMRRMA